VNLKTVKERGCFYAAEFFSQQFFESLYMLHFQSPGMTSTRACQQIVQLDFKKVAPNGDFRRFCG
jgi:hypothetical protein